MVPRLDPEYRRMLDAPADPAGGSRGHAIEYLQKQIDFHVGETNRLRYAQNFHAFVSSLPPELLAEVFLYIVQSGLRDGTCFDAGTFSFLRVCRHWNEVAVGSPGLWSWWIAGAFKAWPIFSSRLKNGPIFLTWRRHLPTSARDVLLNPTIPERVRRFDFIGTSEQLKHLLGVFDPSPPSNASFIRLQISPHDNREPREHLSRLLSSSFPRLSHLDIGNFLPSTSSPILTTSSLTSLKLLLPYGTEGQYYLPQFSHILQQHPKLRELELSHGAIPLPGPPGASPVPFELPDLSNLRLYGRETVLLGFLDFIGMSSPLHNVVVCFSHIPTFTPPAPSGAVKKVLVAYYECQGLSHPRNVNHLTISYDSDKALLAFNTRLHPAPLPNLKSNLSLQLSEVSERDRRRLVRGLLPLFPLDNIRGLVLQGSSLSGDEPHQIFRKMKHLLHLELDDLDPWLVLEALVTDDRDGHFPPVLPELESLTLSHLDVLFGSEGKLLDFLRLKRNHHRGLKNLVLRWCRVHKEELRLKFGGWVGKVGWNNVTAVGSDFQGSDSESEIDGMDIDIDEGV